MGRHEDIGLSTVAQFAGQASGRTTVNRGWALFGRVGGLRPSLRDHGKRLPTLGGGVQIVYEPVTAGHERATECLGKIFTPLVRIARVAGGIAI